MPSAKAKREYYLRNRERCIERSRRQRSEGGERYRMMVRNCMLRQRYGIDHDEYERMLERQGGACAICGTERPAKNERWKRFDIDHCHRTGRVRGLLCKRCNKIVGVLELPEINAARRYLERA
jgi:Recombination endonuclease VII